MVFIIKLFIQKKAGAIGVTCRVLIALVGGFILANLVATLIAYLLADKNTGYNVDGIVTGMMSSFIIYTLAVIYVFSTKSASRAAFGITAACLTSFGIISTFDMAVKL